MDTSYKLGRLLWSELSRSRATVFPGDSVAMVQITDLQMDVDTGGSGNWKWTVGTKFSSQADEMKKIVCCRYL